MTLDEIKARVKDAKPQEISPKKRAKKIKAFREELRSRLARRQNWEEDNLVEPPVAPRYDEVFIEGMKWLDSLAGPALESSTGTMVVSPEVWKSKARRGDDVP
jgi:hypothetical protein